MDRRQFSRLFVAISMALVAVAFASSTQPVTAAPGEYRVWLWDSCLYDWNFSTLDLIQVGCDTADFHYQDDQGCFHHAIDGAWVPYGCFYIDSSGNQVYDIGFTDGMHFRYHFDIQQWAMYFVDAQGYVHLRAGYDGTWSAAGQYGISLDAEIALNASFWDLGASLSADTGSSGGTVSVGGSAGPEIRCTDIYGNQISCNTSSSTVSVGGTVSPQLYCTDQNGVTTECSPPATSYGACLELHDSNVDYDGDGRVGLNELSEYCSTYP